MIDVTPIDAGRRNLMLLVQLRWLAVAGQLAAILTVHFVIGVRLPIAPMIAVLDALVLLNIVALLAERRRPVTNLQLFAALLLDVAALTAQLYLSGGPTNPFVTLYLLQVVLGAVLLEAWSSWAMVGITSAAFAGVAAWHRPLALPPGYASEISMPYVAGLWFNFTLAAILLVLFVTRIAKNLASRDAHLAALRQRAAEEEHIVRMGLLASGAAHELGTPLGSVAIALGDWRDDPGIAADPRLSEEVAEMLGEIARCKDILSGVLLAAGEVSGQAAQRTTLRRFLAELIGDRPNVVLRDLLGGDVPIASDRALAQTLTNLLDNAAEAGAGTIIVIAERAEENLMLTVRDDGRGFPPDLLPHLGKPYQTSKAKRGAGLGLFLATNVLRTLGGELTTRNVEGGAEVRLSLPLAALALELVK